MTCECIESIYKHTKEISFEIILVDNASVECNPIMFLDKFPEIKLIRNKQNVGFSKGNNIGIKNSRGKYIFLLNNDTYLIENSVKKLISFVERIDSLGAISPRIISPNGKIQHVAQRFPSIRLLLLQLFRLHKLLSQKKAGDILLGSYFKQDKTQKVDWIWGTAFLFKREVLNLLKKRKLCDKYFMYQEDMKWCFDFKQIKKDNFFFSETEIVHLGGGSNFQNKNKVSEENFYDFMIQTKGEFYTNIYKNIQKCF